MPTLHELAIEAFLDLLTLYFRVELSGIQYFPRSGGAIIIANHSGCAGTDALLLAHEIHRVTGRQPRIMAHRAYFEWFRWLRTASFHFGLREPHLRSALRTLRHGHLLIVFPEGEAGNFKSSLKRYRLQPFHAGFIRMAEKAQVPIVPCLITGAEEAHLNLGSVGLDRIIPGLRLPLPLNLFPLPSKWNIRFLKPVFPEEVKGATAAEHFRTQMQRELNRALRRRPFVFFPRLL